MLVDCVDSASVVLPPPVATASSCSPTPSLSPQTPQLVRSESSDSRTLDTPSPLTPHFSSFDHLASHHPQQPTFYCVKPQYKMDDAQATIYPPIPEARAAMPYPMPSAQQQPSAQPHPVYRTSTSPQSEPSRVSTVSSVGSKPAPKKNQYPCPMAKQYNCSDFFTTSGHAARHAKKHTGKKDAFCPECNKAFTRKDNMEQHRRTHQNVRGPAKVNTDNRVKKPAKQPARKSDRPVTAPLEAAVAQMEEAAQQQSQQGMMPPGPYFLNPGPVEALPQPMPTDFSGRPPLYRSNFTNSLDYMPPQAQMITVPNEELHYSYPSPGLSNGLNTLALAASDHSRRMSDEESN